MLVDSWRDPVRIPIHVVMSSPSPASFLQPRRLARALAGFAIGTEIQVHEELTSTNDYVRELGFTGYPHGLVVFAEGQTAGRGRRENRWQSEPGRDLLFSILLRPTARVECWPRVTTLAALAICKAIEGCTPLKPVIKWPNDVLVGERKCAGILAETFTGGSGMFMVLGIGLNANTESYPPELRETATSLKRVLQRDLDRTALAIALLKQLDLQVQGLEDGYAQAVEEVRQRSWLLGRRVTARVQLQAVVGIASSLDHEGHLVLQQDDGQAVTLTSAEHVRPI
ncbi:MAG: biotin--[acetyl-CoA-carboxylase] ligase [Roseimicrobium sp.]